MLRNSQVRDTDNTSIGSATGAAPDLSDANNDLRLLCREFPVLQERDGRGDGVVQDGVDQEQISRDPSCVPRVTDKDNPFLSGLNSGDFI